MKQEKIVIDERINLQRQTYGTMKKKIINLANKQNFNKLHLQEKQAIRYKMAEKIEKERNEYVPLLDISLNDLNNRRKLQKTNSFSSNTECGSYSTSAQTREINSPASAQIFFSQNTQSNNERRTSLRRSKYIQEISKDQMQEKTKDMEVRQNQSQVKSKIFNNYNLVRKLTSEAFIGSIVILIILIYKFYQLYSRMNQ